MKAQIAPSLSATERDIINIIEEHSLYLMESNCVKNALPASNVTGLSTREEASLKNITSALSLTVRERLDTAVLDQFEDTMLDDDAMTHSVNFLLSGLDTPVNLLSALSRKQNSDEDYYVLERGF